MVYISENVGGTNARIAAKLESLEPQSSVKDRLGGRPRAACRNVISQPSGMQRSHYLL